MAIMSEKEFLRTCRNIREDQRRRSSVEALRSFDAAL